IPPPINSQSDRCRGDAWASRGNHTRGTETARPSVSVTESESLEHETSTANASVLSVKVLIPRSAMVPGTTLAGVTARTRAAAAKLPGGNGRYVGMSRVGVKPRLFMTGKNLGTRDAL